MENIDPIIDLTQRIPIEEFEVFKKKDSRKPLSLLSGYAIKDIADLVKETPDKINRPLALLMTVTNLQGLIIQSGDDGSNKSISNAEYRQFLFYPELKAQFETNEKTQFQKMWEKAIDSCRASGAFPVAFPPISDTSSLGSINLEYLSDDYFENRDRHSGLDINLPIVKVEKENIEVNPGILDKLAPINPDPKIIFSQPLPVVTVEVENRKIELNYSDGGILDNLPILKGLNLEASIANISNTEIQEKILMPQVEKDNNYPEFRKSLLEKYPEINSNYQRLYVYVKPNPVSNIKSSDKLTKKHFTMLETLLSSLTLPHDEHEAIQLKQIIEIEGKVKIKKSLLEQIQNVTTKRELDKIVPFNSIQMSLISPLLINTIKEAIDIKENITDTHTRLQKLKPIYEQLIQKKTIKEGLETEDANKILASDFINAFGGFFDKKYREHDFLLGRICGVTWLYANFDIEHSNSYIQQLADEVNPTMLSDNPSIGNLRWKDRARILRIILRFFRIAVLELKSDKINNIWDLLYLPIAFLAVVLLRSLDSIVTIFLLIFDRIGKPFDKSQK